MSNNKYNSTGEYWVSRSLIGLEFEYISQYSLPLWRIIVNYSQWWYLEKIIDVTNISRFIDDGNVSTHNIDTDIHIMHLICFYKSWSFFYDFITTLKSPKRETIGHQNGVKSIFVPDYFIKYLVFWSIVLKSD
jgi:hypothetical protein